MVRVRAFAVLAALVLAACAAPGRGSSEPHRIAFLHAFPSTGSLHAAVLLELRTAGFLVGSTLEVLGDSDGSFPDPESAAAAVTAWRDEGVDLIVALSTFGARIAADLVPEAGVLFVVNDPVAVGLVADPFAPEGMTGVTYRVPADRTLSLVQRTLPGAAVGLAYPSGDPAADAHREAVEEAAAEVGVRVTVAPFEDGDVGAAVDRLVEQGVGALLLSSSPAALGVLAETEEAARGHGLPVIATAPVSDVALLSLYPDGHELGRQLGRQAARLLSGSSPASIPVEDPRRFHTEVDLRVARALGVTVPEDVIAEATRVVQ